MQHDYEIGERDHCNRGKNYCNKENIPSEISKPLKVQAEKGVFFHGGSLQG